MVNIYTLGMAGTLFAMCLLNGVKESSRNKSMLCIYVLFWGSLMAFRSLDVGTDTYAYSVNAFFEFATQSTDASEFYKMPVYAMYNNIIGVFGTNPHIPVLFNSFIYVIGVCLFLYYNSENFSMSCFYFISIAYYFFAMNAARQSLAMMLVLWAYHFMARRSYISATLMMLLAVGTHATAIAGMLIIILPLLNMNRKKFLMAAIISFVSIFMFETFMGLYVKLFPAYAGYMDISRPNSLHEASEGKRIYVGLIFLVMLVICYFWKKKKRIIFHDENAFWSLFTIALIGIEFMILLYHNSFAARIEYYFTYFFMLFLPLCIERFFAKESRYIAYGGTIVIFLILFYIRIQPYLPYILWG